MSIEAMKLALDKFESMGHEDSIFADEFDQEISVLRQAIKQAEQAEPVAWRMYPFDYGIGMGQYYALTNLPEQVCAWQNKGWKVEPLYTHPTYSVNMETFENEVQLGVIRHWPDGFADRLEYVWKDLIGFTPNYKLYDLKRVLAEFGFTMRIYEGNVEKDAGL